MSLTKLATAAVRLVNKENDIRLKKIAEFGNETLGAVVYKDAQWCEYRVMFFVNGAHMVKADFLTASILQQDKDEALTFAAAYAEVDRVPATVGNSADGNQMEAETADAIAAVEAHAATSVAEVREVKPARPRPRGYYAQPSPLLKGLFSRVS